MQLDRRRFLGAALAASTAALAARALGQSAPEAVAEPRALAPFPEDLVPSPAAEEWPLLARARAALDAHGIALRDRVAVVDFARHSRDPRLHLVNLEQGRVERSWLVAHGSGSDPSATGMLHSFSNQPGSFASSEGAFLTGDLYLGQHGRSQKLIGLDATNSMAEPRAIVIHGAEYVDPALIAAQGRIGRSQGCFAVEPAEVARVMDALGPGRLIYAAKIA